MTTMNEEIEAWAQAVCEHFKCAPEDITTERGVFYGQGIAFSLETEPGQYVICTDDEADAAWDAALESYIDDCILPELPDLARNYFDSERWKRDARFDGRAHSLSSYDGNEHEVKIGDEWFYIYRTN